MIFTWTLLTTSVIVLSMPSSPLEESISEEMYPPHDINMRSYHFCGKKLTNTLRSVCSGIYNPMFKKNDEGKYLTITFFFIYFFFFLSYGCKKIDNSYIFNLKMRLIYFELSDPK